MESIHFCILLALASEPLNANAIHKQIRSDSGVGAIYIQLSTICKTLKKLKTRHIVESYLNPVTNLATYKLTPLGRRLFKSETFRLEAAARLAQARIKAVSF